MRIIAGERRGLILESPTSLDVRPTSDRVRESIFNLLREDLVDRLIIDLFAGTGAMGLEALSRGAERAFFIERDRATAALIRRNVAKLRYEDRGRVIPTDAHRWVAGFRPLDETPYTVLIDPPYSEYKRHPERMARIIQTFVDCLPDDSVILVESGAPLGADFLPDPDLWKPRAYGSCHITLRRIERSTEPAPSENPGEVEASASHEAESHHDEQAS